MLNDFLNTDFWQMEYFQNSLRDYLMFVLISFLLLFVFWLFKKVIINKLHDFVVSTKFQFDDVVVSALKAVSSFFLVFVSFYLASNYLFLGNTLERVLTGVFVVLTVYQVVKFALVFVDYGVRRSIEAKPDAGSKTAAIATKLVLKILLWSLAFILVLDNLGVDVTSLVAGLGISGIAVALAVQNILSDLFSSFTIYFDKPFEVGDFIAYGNHLGTVQKIGLKTTRLESLDGENIVVSNKALTEAVVLNYSRMKSRRVLIKVGISYDTPVEKVKNVSGFIKEEIDKIEGIKFFRASLFALNDFSLDYEVVFYVEDNDYLVFAAKQEEVFVSILARFQKEGISIPFPTRTIIEKAS